MSLLILHLEFISFFCLQMNGNGLARYSFLSDHCYSASRIMNQQINVNSINQIFESYSYDINLLLSSMEYLINDIFCLENHTLN